MSSAASNNLDDDAVMPIQPRLEGSVLHRPVYVDRPVVMVVDDDRVTAEMYSLSLEAAGFKTIPLSDVSSIFLAIEAEIPDVVVLDFHLGGDISGVNVLEILRLDPRTSNVIAFILSNHPGDRDGQVDRAFSAGAAAWLLKVKTSPAQLTSRVTQALASTNAAEASNPV
ncbi:MAG TPA: response regulator [Candidatus Dormibacteraeota bacterium]|nr:response regulator [Candidatus Dormibacteraeota bacterium]